MRLRPSWRWFNSAGWKVQRLAAVSWLADGLLLLGGWFYVWQSWMYAHSQASLLDEGAYLVKGFLYATGKYWPYQDFGPWANHMPLAFVIPGWVQLIFGPGLRTGRYLAIFLGIVMLVGLGLVARRLGNRWWAAGAVWVVALNPALVKMYSIAVTQVLMSAMLVWMLAASLGADRRTWQLVAAAILAGAMLLTRLNFFPVLPLLLVYIYWQHGWRKTFWAALAGGLVVGLGHAIFWPGILRLWAAWLPTELGAFLASYRPPPAIPYWDPNTDFESRLHSFFLGFRFHFTASMGALAAALLWPRRIVQKFDERVRACIFLGGLFLLFFCMHAWAALGVHSQTDAAYGKDYCVFCFSVYLAFFANLGLVLFIIAFPLLERNLPRWRQILIGLVLLVISAGLGYSSGPQVGMALLSWLKLPVPRMRAFRILPGTTTLGGLLENKSGLAPQVFERLMRQFLPVLAGILIAGVLLYAAIRLARYSVNRQTTVSPGYAAMILFIAVGAVLSPTEILGGGYHTYDCSGDVITSYETAGKHLASVIPAGALVYWRGGNSAVPLLYLPGRDLFPAQLNGDYSFRLDGDPQAVARYGYWNDVLAQQWTRQANYLLVSEEYYTGWLRELLTSGAYGEKTPTLRAAKCRSDTVIHIFERNR